jgi:hypothetical protein
LTSLPEELFYLLGVLLKTFQVCDDGAKYSIACAVIEVMTANLDLVVRLFVHEQFQQSLNTLEAFRV